MFPIREFFSTKKSDKTAEWANKIIRYIRMNDQPLISQDEAYTGMAYLLGKQNLEYVVNLFQNATRLNLTNENSGRAPRGAIVNQLGQRVSASSHHDETILKEMASLDFKALPIMEKFRNINVAEMKKMGVVANARSNDPTSTSKRIQDRDFIENKDAIESFFTYVYTSIGQPAFKLKDNKKRFGEKHDNGNTDIFEQMGLNPKDPTDVKFFFDFFHKLDEEITVQDIINYVSSYNQWELDIEKWVNDLMSKKAVAATCYVSDVTGAIMAEYISPESVWIYGGGNRQDFNDANAKRYERMITVKQMLDKIGNKFDMEAQFNNLLLAITYASKIEFTGIAPSYRGFVCGDEKLTGRSDLSYNYDQFLAFKINVGYIEFTTQNQETFGDVLTSANFYQNNQSPDGKYPTKSRWETPTYKSYYLAVSQIDQVLFDFGEVSYQDILGSCDFNVNFSIVTYKEPGDPIAIQAIPLLDIMHEAWYKWRYEVRRAKPRGRGYNYDSIVSTVMNMIPDTTMSDFNKLQKVMELLDSSSNEIYQFPIVEGKAVQIPGNQLNYDIPNGLNKESMLWWEIFMSAGKYLADMIGIAPLREGDPGNARDSMNNQFKALEYSQAATYYVPDMLTYLFQQLSVKANFFAQDIVTYKDYNTVAYKWLENAVGEESLDKLKKLGKVAQHRFGIFIESLNLAPLKQELQPMLFEAVKNGKIDVAQYLLIRDEKNIKKAYQTFAYFEQRNKKIAQQSEQELQKQQHDQAMQIQQMAFNIKKMDGDYMLAGKRIDAQAGQNEHLTNQLGGLAKTKLKLDGDRDEIYHQLKADVLKELMLVNQGGGAAPIPPLPASQNPTQEPQSPQQPPSQIEQLRQSTDPANAGAMV